MSIRAARPADVPAILELVRGLAAYEEQPDAVQTTEADLQRALFERAEAFAHVAEQDEGLGGFALWFPTFSTWTGQPGMWLEDLFVRPEARRNGLGRRLLQALAQVCVERGYERFEWTVLDWNTPAHAFYTALGAAPQDDWTTWRVAGPALAGLAHG